MSKVIIIISVLLISISFSGCGRKSDPIKPSQIIKMN